MKKLYLNIAGYIMLLILSGTLLYHMCQSTNQAAATFLPEAEFVGEYSLDGSEWKPIEKKYQIFKF